jgi:cholesterol transport system auxiliary component
MKRALLPFAVLLVTACAGLQPPPAQPVSTYLLEAQPAVARDASRRDLALAVSTPRARAGFDSPQMAYVRRPHELEYFANNRWADAPARMLAPLITQALERSGSWRSVLHNPSVASADLRLDTELVRLVQDFTAPPSRIRITLRAELIDTASGRVLAVREFDEVEVAPRDDPYGGVLAANRGLERLLGNLAGFASGAQLPAVRPGAR